MVRRVDGRPWRVLAEERCLVRDDARDRQASRGGPQRDGRAGGVAEHERWFGPYATGRSSRASGPSELDRPETVEETGELIRAAGGSGAVRVVDHEDLDAVAELVAAVERESGRLDVLVNDIFGGDRYMQWDKPLWEHDWQGGLRMLQVGVHTHLITALRRSR